MGWKVKRRERHALIEVDDVNPLIHRGTFHIGPRHVKHYASKEFVEHAYVENPDFASEQNCRVFAQSSNIAVEVYDFYNKLFDPDYENVSVYDERFEVQYLFKEPDTWRSADYYNPKIEVISLEDGVDIKKTFDTDYGAETLEITYTVRTGARLKHTIVFTNKTAQQRTFRVVMKFSGITSDKVRYGQIEEQITEKKHVVAPVMFFGEDNQHLKLSEYLWRLGKMDEKTGEWSPTTLKDIVLDVHAQGCKADIIIGNYTLTQNESLEIDPDTATLTPPTKDARTMESNPDFNDGSGLALLVVPTTNGVQRIYTEFDISSIDAGATIIAGTELRLYCTYTGASGRSYYIERITGAWVEAEITWNAAPAITTTNRATVDAPAAVGWWSGECIDVVQDGRDAGTTVGLRMRDTAEGGTGHSTFSSKEGANDPVLYVVYTVVVSPTVTTQAATGLTVGAGTLHGTITATGGENCTQRGFDYDYDTGVPYTYSWTESGSYGVGTFLKALTGLTQGNTVYFRGKAYNSAGWGYGGELNFVVRKAVERSASAAIGIVGISGRGFVGTRSVAPSLSLVGTTGRTLAAFRSASAAMSIVGTATRSWVGTRAASAAIGVSAVAGRIKGMIRTASASMSIVGTANRTLHAVRSAVANVGIVGTALRGWVGSRSAPATMAITGTSNRLLSSLRTASASLGMVATAVRSGVFTRSASGDMTIQGAALRSWIGSRAADASMAVTGVADRLLNRVRSASASMSQVAVAARSVVVTRVASGNISMQGTPIRMLASVRSAAASISSSATARRTLFARRAASASIAITGTATRMLGAIRSASASVSLTATSERMLAAFRSASAAITATAVGGFIGRVIGGAVTLQLAGKTRLLDFVGKEQTLTLSLKSAVLNLADKIRTLKLGRKET